MTTETITDERDFQAQNGINASNRYEDLEEEGYDPNEKITKPFDPDLIRIRTAPYVIQQMIDRIAHQEIDLEPDFQRRTGIWNSMRKSRLIESLLLRVPIPAFYVAADIDDRWTVVDGIQRLSTINDFVTSDFELRQLEYLIHFEGLKHDELPRPMQRRISETQLTVSVIEPGTPPEVMFNVFLRINTGGQPLKAQEIRHALHPDPARRFLKTLAESDAFIAATGGTVNPLRMDDRECVLRYLAFKINRPEEYSSKSLDGFLNNAMVQLNEMSESERDLLSDDFERSMRTANAMFREYAFRKRYKLNDRRRQVNRALFEAWAVHLARCNQEQSATLIKERARVNREFIWMCKNDSDFENAISASTNSIPRVHKRFAAIGKLIAEVAGC